MIKRLENFRAIIEGSETCSYYMCICFCVCPCVCCHSTPHIQATEPLTRCFFLSFTQSLLSLLLTPLFFPWEFPFLLLPQVPIHSFIQCSAFIPTDGMLCTTYELETSAVTNIKVSMHINTKYLKRFQYSFYAVSILYNVYTQYTSCAFCSLRH